MKYRKKPVIVEAMRWWGHSHDAGAFPEVQFVKNAEKP